MIAINDGYLLESVAFQLLRKHLISKPYYMDLVQLFIAVSLMISFCISHPFAMMMMMMML